MKPFVRPLNAQRMKGAVANAIASSVLLVFASCGIPKLQHAQPGAPLPDTFNGAITPESSAQVGIDEFFRDPLLATLIREGLVGNQQLRIMGQDIQVANYEILRRRGAFLPFISFGAGARLDKFSSFTKEGASIRDDPFRDSQFLPNPLPDFMIAADVSWQIDIWRQLRNARDAAGLRYLATIDGRTYTVTRLVAEIAENYYTLMALDKRLENLDQTIGLFEHSLQIAVALKEAARGTELGVQRFQAEVQRNQSEKLIIQQQIVETENRINFLLGRFPQPVQRRSEDFYELNLPELMVGVPPALLLNRPDIRQAERQVQAAGLDVRVARANFFPKLVMSAGVGVEAFNPKFLFNTPESLIYNTAGNLVAPLVNRSAIRAEYLTANARQLQTIYDYQRTVLNAFTEVINRVTKVRNYTQSMRLKNQQLTSLESAVNVSSSLFQNARVEFGDVLFAQRDMRDARTQLIDIKREQLSAIVNAYQALGGGADLTMLLDWPAAVPPPDPLFPGLHWFSREEDLPPADKAPPPEALPPPSDK
jgi:multidrug efflux system outer membrane protein